MALFSSAEIIALYHNWGPPSGSRRKWSWVQFEEICYAQLPPINSSGSDVPDLLLGILRKQLLFTVLPLKDEIHEQGLTGQKITVYVSTYLPSAAKNLVSSAPGTWLQPPESGLPGKAGWLKTGVLLRVSMGTTDYAELQEKGWVPSQVSATAQGVVGSPVK